MTTWQSIYEDAVSKRSEFRWRLFSDELPVSFKPHHKILVANDDSSRIQIRAVWWALRDWKEWADLKAWSEIPDYKEDI